MSNKVMGFLAGAALTLFLAGPLAAAVYTVETVPNVHLQDKTRYLSNPDGIVGAQDEAAINAMLYNLELETGIQIAVVALDSIGDADYRSFATKLFNHWGIGDSRDRGLLIQLITEKSQRSITYETGYGLEGVLTDAVALRMRQVMLPDLQNGDYSVGLLKGVTATVDYLKANDDERAAFMDADEAASNDSPAWLAALILLVPLGIIGTIPLLARRPKICPNCGKKTYYYEGRETIRAATTLSTGLAREIRRCRSCGHIDHREVTLAKIQPVTTSGGGGFGGRGGGGGFGGGGGGGSWGGGRSGGGGGGSRF